MSDKKERILLTQIKQDFTTPVDAISDYINLIIDSSDIYDAVSYTHLTLPTNDQV